jgi:hypothetical protein
LNSLINQKLLKIKKSKAREYQIILIHFYKICMKKHLIHQIIINKNSKQVIITLMDIKDKGKKQKFKQN